MNYPDSLPWMLEYQCGKTVRMTMPRRPVQSVSSSGVTDACIICPQIPYGTTGWRKVGEDEWRALDTLPREWMPFLERNP